MQSKEQQKRYREIHKQEKSLYSKNYYQKNKDKIKSRCKVYSQSYRNSERGKETRIKNYFYSKYGITLEQYNEMYNNQQGKCDICHNPFTSKTNTHLDHDHLSGKIRGLLCNHCNHGLGEFKDNQITLLNAYRYLSKWSNSSQILDMSHFKSKIMPTYHTDPVMAIKRYQIPNNNSIQLSLLNHLSAVS